MIVTNKRRNEVTTTIDGFKVVITKNNIHVENSYLAKTRKEVKKVLNDIEAFLEDRHITVETPFDHRSIYSMTNEWIAHNNAYKLNFRPEQSRSVDLDWPQPWYTPILYFVCSIIVL